MKKFLKGLILGVALTSSVSVIASSGRSIQVFDIVKRIVVNKEVKPFEKGKEPFVYNGTTYVPLRFIAESLGEEVDWDREMGTVYVGEKDIVEVHDLTDMKTKVMSSRNMKFWNNRGSKDELESKHLNYLEDVTGEIHNSILYCDESYSGASAYQVYALKGQYKKFIGNLGVFKLTRLSGDGKSYLKIYLDDDLAYSSSIKRTDFNKNIELDLTGVMQMRIEFEGSGAGIYDSKFYK